jgi:hypothetical protein
MAPHHPGSCGVTEQQGACAGCLRIFSDASTPADRICTLHKRAYCTRCLQIVVFSNQQVVDFVRERLQGGASPAEAAAALCDHCLAPTLYR